MSIDRYISHKQYTTVRSNDYILTFAFSLREDKKILTSLSLTCWQWKILQIFCTYILNINTVTIYMSANIKEEQKITFTNVTFDHEMFCNLKIKANTIKCRRNLSSLTSYFLNYSKITYLSSFLRSYLSKIKHFTYITLANDLEKHWINKINNYVGFVSFRVWWESYLEILRHSGGFTKANPSNMFSVHVSLINFASTPLLRCTCYSTHGNF